jgi:hypothetical protein
MNWKASWRCWDIKTKSEGLERGPRGVISMFNRPVLFFSIQKQKDFHRSDHAWFAKGMCVTGWGNFRKL